MILILKFRVFSRGIKMINDRKPGWEPMLPPGIAEIIKEHSLFGTIRLKV
jgi:hypothetical protein